MEIKVDKHFSGPLFRRSVRSNLVLTIIVLLVMCLMTTVITFAGSILEGFTDETYDDAQNEFYSYLYGLASYNEMAGTNLNYYDFIESNNEEAYEQVFSMLTAQTGAEYSAERFRASAEKLSESDVSIDAYIGQFEYVYAFSGMQGCFSGDDLDLNGMMATMLEVMGMSPSLMENMEDVDSSSMINQFYYTMMLILPILVFIIIVGNSLVVDQVDKGSMAYVLSTPTKRSAVAVTQMIYMIIVPLIMMCVVFLVRLGAFHIFGGEPDIPQLLALYGGLYILIEAMAAICYMASCIFNLSKYAMALGGGINIWCFLASLVGMFGSDMMVEAGIGVEALGTFNHLTLIGLVDTDALSTVGSGAVDTSFIWKLCVLLAIAVVCYAVGAIRFQKKDLPL